MRKASKMVAWIGVVNSLFLGCYSLVTIEPTVENKDRIGSNEILEVVSNDSTKYVFQESPTVANDTIAGAVLIRVDNVMMKKRVSIPLSDVVEVTVREEDVTLTVVTIGALVGGLALWIGLALANAHFV
jgi:hypothetical protein